MREAVEGPAKETEQIRISSNLRDNEIYIRKQCENCADILVRPMRLGEDRKVDCLMVYIEVTVSNMMLDDSAIGKMINHFWKIPPEKIQEFLKNNSLGIADVQKLENMDEVFGAILSGNAVFFIDGYNKAMKISSKGYPDMGVSEAESEKVLRGSREGFSDSVKTNSALVRKRIRDTRMKVEEYQSGVRSNTTIQILYIEDLVHEELLEEVKNRLEEYKIDGILDEVKDFAECGLCGTAAVISPVGKIVDHGKEICFPSGMEEMGPTTKKLYETLTGIQMGRIEAPEGWIKVIE